MLKEDKTFTFEGYCLDPWGWNEWVLKFPDNDYETRWWFQESFKRYVKKGGRIPDSLLNVGNKIERKIVVFYRERPIDKKPIFAIKISSILFYKCLLFRRKYNYVCIARG